MTVHRALHMMYKGPSIFRGDLDDSAIHFRFIFGVLSEHLLSFCREEALDRELKCSKKERFDHIFILDNCMMPLQSEAHKFFWNRFEYFRNVPKMLLINSINKVNQSIKSIESIHYINKFKNKFNQGIQSINLTDRTKEID